MSLPAFSLSNIDLFIGRELGVSRWTLIDQPRIDGFAHCTGDDQWIHVDAERARRESQYETTVAQGFLTLATLAASALEVYLRPAGIKQALNYGLDRVLFIAPVKMGSRIRTHIKLVGVEPQDDGRMLIKTESTVEIEGHYKPALVARSLVLLEA